MSRFLLIIAFEITYLGMVLDAIWALLKETPGRIQSSDQRTCDNFRGQVTIRLPVTSRKHILWDAHTHSMERRSMHSEWPPMRCYLSIWSTRPACRSSRAPGHYRSKISTLAPLLNHYYVWLRNLSFSTLDKTKEKVWTLALEAASLIFWAKTLFWEMSHLRLMAPNSFEDLLLRRHRASKHAPLNTWEASCLLDTSRQGPSFWAHNPLRSSLCKARFENRALPRYWEIVSKWRLATSSEIQLIKKCRHLALIKKRKKT